MGALATTLFSIAAGALRPAFRGLALAFGLAMLCAAAGAAEAPRFEGRVVVEWLDQEGSSRNMRLLEPFTFVDPSGKRWVGILFSIFLALIFLGSIMLGWHYAIDAYAGAAVAVFGWWAAGRPRSRWRAIWPRWATSSPSSTARPSRPG